MPRSLRVLKIAVLALPVILAGAFFARPFLKGKSLPEAGAAIDKAAAIALVEKWAGTIHDTRAEIHSIGDGLARPVGSLLFQYEPANRRLTVHGSLFIDTSTLVDPSDTLRRCRAYAGKHPHRLPPGSTIVLLTPEQTADQTGRIALSRSFETVPAESDFIPFLHDLSKAADLWRRVDIQNALFGLNPPS